MTHKEPLNKEKLQSEMKIIICNVIDRLKDELGKDYDYDLSEFPKESTYDVKIKEYGNVRIGEFGLTGYIHNNDVSLKIWWRAPILQSDESHKNYSNFEFDLHQAESWIFAFVIKNFEHSRKNT